MMLTGNTITKLQEMHLTVMANALKEQLSDANMNSLSFEDRIGLLVDREWTSRKNNHLKRLIRNAGLSDPNACVENIEYHSDRNLDKSQIARLSTCNYITDHRNVMLLGATGSGKTWVLQLMLRFISIHQRLAWQKLITELKKILITLNLTLAQEVILILCTTMKSTAEC